jgi:hypothetical protein
VPLSIAAWLVASSAFAQAEPSSSEIATARSLFYEGVEASREENWPVAEERFARAYEIVRQPQTLINLAGARAHLGRLLEASETYRDFLRLASAEERARWSAEVEAALSSIEARIGRVVLDVDLADRDRITLDGAPFSRAMVGVEVPVDPGLHRIAVVRSDREIASREVTVAEGARESIAIALPAQPSTPVVVPVERDAPERPSDDDSFWSTAWPWVIGGGLIAAATVVVLVLVLAPEPFEGNVPPGFTEVP